MVETEPNGTQVLVEPGVKLAMPSLVSSALRDPTDHTTSHLEVCWRYSRFRKSIPYASSKSTRLKKRAATAGAVAKSGRSGS